MSISNASKYRNPMPFRDLEVGDYFTTYNGIIYRKLEIFSVQITNNPSWKLIVPHDSDSWSDGVYKVEIVKMEYKEL